MRLDKGQWNSKESCPSEPEWNASYKMILIGTGIQTTNSLIRWVIKMTKFTNNTQKLPCMAMHAADFFFFLTKPYNKHMQ